MTSEKGATAIHTGEAAYNKVSQTLGPEILVKEPAVLATMPKDAEESETEPDKAVDGLDPDKACAEAVKIQQFGEHEKSAQLYRAILEEYPEHFETLLRLGVMLMGAGNLKEANPLLKLAAAIPGPGQIYAERAYQALQVREKVHRSTHVLQHMLVLTNNDQRRGSVPNHPGSTPGSTSSPRELSSSPSPEAPPCSPTEEVGEVQQKLVPEPVLEAMAEPSGETPSETLERLRKELHAIHKEAEIARQLAQNIQRQHREEVLALREQVKRSRFELQTIQKAVSPFAPIKSKQRTTISTAPNFSSPVVLPGNDHTIVPAVRAGHISEEEQPRRRMEAEVATADATADEELRLIQECGDPKAIEAAKTRVAEARMAEARMAEAEHSRALDPAVEAEVWELMYQGQHEENLAKCCPEEVPVQTEAEALIMRDMTRKEIEPEPVAHVETEEKVAERVMWSRMFAGASEEFEAQGIPSPEKSNRFYEGTGADDDDAVKEVSFWNSLYAGSHTEYVTEGPPHPDQPSQFYLRLSLERKRIKEKIEESDNAINLRRVLKKTSQEFGAQYDILTTGRAQLWLNLMQVLFESEPGASLSLSFIGNDGVELCQGILASLKASVKFEPATLEIKDDALDPSEKAFMIEEELEAHTKMLDEEADDLLNLVDNMAKVKHNTTITEDIYFWQQVLCAMLDVAGRVMPPHAFLSHVDNFINLLKTPEGAEMLTPRESAHTARGKPHESTNVVQRTDVVPELSEDETEQRLKEILFQERDTLAFLNFIRTLPGFAENMDIAHVIADSFSNDEFLREEIMISLQNLLEPDELVPLDPLDAKEALVLAEQRTDLAVRKARIFHGLLIDALAGDRLQTYLEDNWGYQQARGYIDRLRTFARIVGVYDEDVIEEDVLGDANTFLADMFAPTADECVWEPVPPLDVARYYINARTDEENVIMAESGYVGRLQGRYLHALKAMQSALSAHSVSAHLEELIQIIEGGQDRSESGIVAGSPFANAALLDWSLSDLRKERDGLFVQVRFYYELGRSLLNEEGTRTSIDDTLGKGKAAKYADVMRSIAKVLADIGVEVDVGLSELMQLCQLELNGLKVMTAVMESLAQLASQVRWKSLEEEAWRHKQEQEEAAARAAIEEARRADEEALAELEASAAEAEIQLREAREAVELANKEEAEAIMAEQSLAQAKLELVAAEKMVTIIAEGGKAAANRKVINLRIKIAELEEIAMKERAEADHAIREAARERKEAEDAEIERRSAAERHAAAQQVAIDTANAEASRLAQVEIDRQLREQIEKEEALASLPSDWQQRIVFVHSSLDEGGDGSISKGELLDMDERLFTALNAYTDGDGQIEQGEFLLFFAIMLKERGMPVAESLLLHLEKYVGKKAEQAELQRQELLQSYRVAASSLSVDQRVRVSALHEHLDKNAKGTIDKAELADLDIRGEGFEKLDECDGTVSPDAFLAFFGTMKSERGSKVTEGFLQHLEAHAEEMKWAAIKALEERCLKSWSFSTAVLSDELCKRAKRLHEDFDGLGNSDGIIQRHELADAEKYDQISQKMDVTSRGHITATAWLAYFGKMRVEEGEQFVFDLLEYFERHFETRRHLRQREKLNMMQMRWEEQIGLLSGLWKKRITLVLEKIDDKKTKSIQKEELLEVDSENYERLQQAEADDPQGTALGHVSFDQLTALFSTVITAEGENAVTKLLDDLEDLGRHKAAHKAMLVELALVEEWRLQTERLNHEQRARVEELHKAFDENKNGTIEKSELCDIDNGDLFDHLNVSLSGSVTLVAFTAFFSNLLLEYGVETWDKTLERLEKNAVAAGRVLKFWNLPVARISAVHMGMDYDHSGTLQKNELLKIDKHGSFFLKMDTDNDGSVAVEEFIMFFNNLAWSRGEDRMKALLEVLEDHVQREQAERERVTALLRGTSKEPGISDEEIVRRTRNEVRTELMTIIDGYKKTRAKGMKKLLRHLDYMLEEDENWADSQVLEELLMDQLMQTDVRVNEARFVQGLIQGALKAPGASKALTAITGVSRETDARNFSRLISCMPIIGERTPKHLAFFERHDPARKYEITNIPPDVRLGKDRVGYCNLMAKLKYQEDEALAITNLYESVLGMVHASWKPSDAEEEEDTGKLLKALGVSVKKRSRDIDVLKSIGGEKAVSQMAFEEQIAINEFVQLDSAETMKQKADAAEEEAAFYENLVRGAFRTQGIINFIEARGGGKAGVQVFGNFLRNLPKIEDPLEVVGSPRVEKFVSIPALSEVDVPHLKTLETTEQLIQQTFVHEERLKAAELRHEQASSLIKMLEDTIQAEYDYLCTDSEGAMLPEVKATLEEIHSQLRLHKEQRRKKEQGLDNSPQGKMNDTVKRTPDNKGDFGSKPAILQIDSTLTHMSLQMAQGDDAGLWELSKMKDDIKATKENPHAFGRGEDPGAPKPGERIPTPRKYAREEFMPAGFKGIEVGDRSHLGVEFWENAPLEYIKSGKRTLSARGRHVPVEAPKLLLVNPEASRTGSYGDDYKSMGTTKTANSSKSDQFSKTMPIHDSLNRVTYDLQLHGQRQAWPENRETDCMANSLSKSGWDPTLPRTPPTRIEVTPIERHRTMAAMLAQKGKASSPLKARQQMMQSVNGDVQLRMSMMMNSVGYGNDGNHLTHKIVQEGNMAMDDELYQDEPWVIESKNSPIEPQPWELQHQPKSLYAPRSILPGIDEQVLTAASLRVPIVRGHQESSLTGSGGENLEFCLERWNELGKMVDTMTKASRTLSRLDRKQDIANSTYPKGSKNNPSDKALNLRQNRRNSRAGDPKWEEW